MKDEVKSDKKKSSIAKQEEVILDFWQKNEIFKKSEAKNTSQGEFVFFDGPPFATGEPHYGHLLVSTIKDAIPRYKTMNGQSVKRRWGWDCHGLPIENIIEKELDFKVKKDIEDYGIAKFNQKAKEAVLRYADVWKETINRLGRFVDMDNDYKTMDASYTESIWWAFDNLYKRGLIYEGFKSMHICPRCETTLSNFEVNQGYTDITDLAVTVKLWVPKLDAYLLAWTTTPWTLPGNVATAVNQDLTYSEVESDDEKYILAEEKVGEVFKDKTHKINRTFSGQELIGLAYEPLFNYFANEQLVNFKKEPISTETIWKIYHAPYVSLDKGTGIVHLAPAFGEEDMELAKEKNLPFIQHVSTAGRFIEAVSDFAGELVKPKADHMRVDILIIKYLASKNLLFAKEKITHSYPLCWRCETPLLNYASSSWFVKVTDLKDKIITENNKINWVPAHFKDGRFGRWLEGARDWAISRSRFWGAPLPVWKCEDCLKQQSVDSIADLLAKSVKSQGANFYLLRHGEATHNQTDIISDQITDAVDLTAKGKQDLDQTIAEFKKHNLTFDLIIASPLVRTKQTAEQVAESLEISTPIIFDSRLQEVQTGLNGQPWSNYTNFFKTRNDRFTQAPPQGETINEVRKRAMELVFDLNTKYAGKNILLVSHGLPLFLIKQSSKGLTSADLKRITDWHDDYLQTGAWAKVDFTPYPHDVDYELDLHRPYIDEVKLKCTCGGEMTRVNDVFDCWFESGSMPFAQAHYPFRAESGFDPKTNTGFPADFIAEAQDQTRGWFYSLIVLSTALFGQSPYKTVIANGMILAEDGQKMSKRLKNYPDVDYVLDTYGADAVRFYLLSSPAVHAEDLAFSEKGLGEIYRKIIMRLTNIIQFYETYSRKIEAETIDLSSNVLDNWADVRIKEAINQIDSAMAGYELDRATRAIEAWLDDFSNWYIRRSRDRFRDKTSLDFKQASQTLASLLKTTAIMMAPFTPFIAEHLYQKLKSETAELSVHLMSWPKFTADKQVEVLALMTSTRNIVSLALEKRAEAGIKVRQPLKQLTINVDLPAGYLDLIKDEVNVWSVVSATANQALIELDTELTEDLKQAGRLRELIRQIQNWRKDQGFSPADEIKLTITVDDLGWQEMSEQLDQIKLAVGARLITRGQNRDGSEIKIDERSYYLNLESKS